jgi:hypothetical protein
MVAMNRSPQRTFALALCLLALSAASAHAEGEGLLASAQNRAADIWLSGASDIYVPFLTHHLRSAYDRERIKRYQERPRGFGYGRSTFDADGDRQGLYAMVYEDSNYKPNYVAGYVYQTHWRPAADWRIGGGFTAFLMMRPDIGHYTPFPAILPVASVAWRDFAIETTFVPGARDAGNVLFFWARLRLE